MSRPPNLCIYCEQPGRSKEHFWGKWLQEHIDPLYPNTKHTTTRINPITGELDWAKGALTRQGNLRSLQIKGPCKACNNNWMRNTNERAKDVILRFIHKGVDELTAKESQCFATWTVMFSMTFECADINTMVTQQDERTFLMKNRRPPPNWSVLIGQFRGFKWREQMNHRALKTGKERGIPDRGNAQCNVFTLGNCAVVTLGGAIAKGNQLKRFAERHHLRIIWPLSMAGSEKIVPLSDEAMWSIARYER